MSGSKPTLKTGLFLGAGASYELGMPLVWDLTKELRLQITPDKLESQCKNWSSNYSAESIDKFRKVFCDENMHYESVIGYLEVQHDRAPSPNDPYHGMRTRLVEWVYGLFLLRHLKKKSYIQTGLQFLDGIRGLVHQNKPLWIFSLNHDMIIECLAAQFSIPISAGLSSRESLPRYTQEGKQNGRLPVEVCKLDPEAVDLSLKFFDQGVLGINLLKLHGGLDIFTRQDGTEIVRLLPTSAGVDGVFESLVVLHDEVKYTLPDKSKLKISNEIAYADDQGEMQFLRRSLVAGVQKYTLQNRQVMPLGYLDVFSSKLKEIQNLICIGYSFGDAHTNNKIRSWLEASETNNLEVVSPGAEVNPTFAHLAGQIKLHRCNATEYLEQFGTPLNDLEKTTRDFRQFQRDRERKKNGFA